MSVPGASLVVLLLVPLLLASSEAHNIWASFMGQGNTVKQHTHAPPPPPKSDLCSDLLSNMKMATEGTPDSCQPLPKEVSGEIKEFCTMAAAEIFNGCKGQDEDCIGDAIQSSGGSELFSGCLCHGYLDVYASLWTTWKLMCESSSSKERGGRKISAMNAVLFEFKVMAASDARILMTGYNGDVNGYEIVIGGWNNSQSVIRDWTPAMSHPDPGHAVTQTPGILDENEYRKFWIQVSVELEGHMPGYYPLTIAVGEGDQDEPFMEHTWEMQCRSIRAIALAGGAEATTSWQFGHDYARTMETMGYDYQYLDEAKMALEENHPFFSGLDCPNDYLPVTYY